jgi:hypothetical protein
MRVASKSGEETLVLAGGAVLAGLCVFAGEIGLVCTPWARSCIVPKTATNSELWIVRRKKPPYIRVISTLT